MRELLRNIFRRYDVGFNEGYDDGFNDGLRWRDKRVQTRILNRLTSSEAVMTKLDVKTFELIVDIVQDS